MKIAYGSLFSLLCITGTCAFAPQSKVSFGVAKKNVALNMFFADQSKDSKPPSPPPEEEEEEEKAEEPQLSLEEEVEQDVKKILEKKKMYSRLSSPDGVDYAPWMGISQDDEREIRQQVLEKTIARRKRQEQEREVSGALLTDSQAQELSGTGLNYKVLSSEEIELEWATSSEANTKGFMIKRRAAKTNEFETIASYEDWGPLVSQGTDGGVYRFLDDNVAPGGWVYRITECENSGKTNDICQCLVEVQTEEEQRGAVIAVGAIAAIGILAVVAGLVLDPVGGY